MLHFQQQKKKRDERTQMSEWARTTACPPCIGHSSAAEKNINCLMDGKMT